MLKLNPKQTALVLIDLQQGILPFAQGPYTGDEIVNVAAKLVEHFHQLNIAIFRVRVGWSANYIEALHSLTDVAPNMQPLPENWWSYPSELPLQQGEIEIVKRQWGAFYGTDLELQLRRRGITTLVLGGISTNIGVESTARNAWERGFSVVIVEDGCSAASVEQHNSSMQWIFPRIARVRTSDTIMAGFV